MLLNNYIKCIALLLLFSFNKCLSFNIKSRVISSIISFGILSNPVISIAQDDPYTASRFTAILNELVRLDSNWDTIVKGEGDNVRRVLGTVYKAPKCESPLCNYPSLIKGYAINHGFDIDLDAYDESSQELLEALNQADFLSYSQVFAEYGNGGGGRYYHHLIHHYRHLYIIIIIIISDYISDSRKQIKRSIKSLEEVIKIIEPQNSSP